MLFFAFMAGTGESTSCLSFPIYFFLRTNTSKRAKFINETISVIACGVMLYLLRFVNAEIQCGKPAPIGIQWKFNPHFKACTSKAEF